VSKQYYVYSTMTAGVRYCAAVESEGHDLPIPQDGINIAGGTGVANKNLITPTGAVATRITAEQLEALRGDRVFLEHEKNGFLRVSEHQADGEAVASDMKSRDASAPLTPQDYEATGAEPPKVGTETPAKPSHPRRA